MLPFRSWSFRSTLLLPCVVVLVLGSFGAATADWPHWRGPHHNGSAEPGDSYPLTWSETENLAWRTPLPGASSSSPVVAGDRLYATSHAGEDLLLLAFDAATGKELWRSVCGPLKKEKIHSSEGSDAIPSPTVLGDRIATFTGNGWLTVFDRSGKQLWQKDLEADYGKIRIGFGMASSPVLTDEALFLQLLHYEGSDVLAFDLATGRELWHVERPTEAREKCLRSYASPLLYDDGTRQLLLVHGQDYLTGHDLKTGRERFRVGGLDLHPESGYSTSLRIAATPSFDHDGYLLAPSAGGGRVAAYRLRPEETPKVEPKPTADGTAAPIPTERLWNAKPSPSLPSPIVYDGIAYVIRDSGDLYAFDLKTGELHYRARTHRSNHRASLVVGDGKLYLLARDGTCSVVKPGPEFELLASNKLDDTFTGSPALSEGRIYLKGFGSLWAIGP